MNRHAAMQLLDHLHPAQHDMYAGGSGAALERLVGRGAPRRQRSRPRGPSA
jgi:hypothetical protein